MIIKFYDSFSSVLKADSECNVCLGGVIQLLSCVSRTNPKFSEYKCFVYHHSLNDNVSCFQARFKNMSQFVNALKKNPYEFYFDARQYDGIAHVVLSNHIID